MKKVKLIVARNAKGLAKALGLTPADAVEFEIRSALNDKIVEVINERGLYPRTSGHVGAHFTDSRDGNSQSKYA